MNLYKPTSRFFFGCLSVLLLLVLGFAWVVQLIPTWGASPEQVTSTLPGDEVIQQPQISWNHAINVHAPVEQVYLWLIQMGDTRAAYYSYTFIENLFMLSAGTSDRYVNADRIHPEWQNPAIGQSMIMNFLAIQDYRADGYVLAGATPEMAGMQWTWLWYLQPVDQEHTRLMVRHHFRFPKEAPKWVVTAVLDAGYVMERGMLLGIRDRVEGRIPPAFFEPLGIVLWSIGLLVGLLAARRFVRQNGEARKVSFHPLGVGLEAVVALFLFTFIQPALWVRILVDLVLIGSLAIAYFPGAVPRLVFKRAAA